MSRFFYPLDTDGDPGGLRLFAVAEQQTEQRAQPNAARRGFITNVRPLTVAEVLPPHLRSGNSSRDVTSFEFWPRPVKAKTPKMTDAHRIYSVRADGVQADSTPIYRPGRYGYNAVREASPAETFPPQKARYREEYGHTVRGATRNFNNEFREVRTQTELASSGAFSRESQESTKSASELKPVPVEVQVQYQPVKLASIDTAVEDNAMLQGEAHGSSSTWHRSPSPGWQSDMGTSRDQPATALTSTLVARMDALRQQLLRVSSTLSGVQERAAHLASSMGHRSHTLYNGGGGDANTSQGSSAVMPTPLAARPMAPAATAAMASSLLTSDLPTQRYFPPVGRGNLDSPSGSSRSASPYGARSNNISETRVYVVSVSAASDSPEPPPPFLTQSSSAGLQFVPLSPSHLTRHQHLPPQRAPQAADQFETPLAAAAVSAAVVASYPAMTTMSSPRPQRSPPAVAVHMGALEGPSYHPFELGSPAGRTMHVVVPELQPPAAGRIGFSPYFAAMDKEQTPSGAEMLGPVATTQSVRKYDRRTGAYYEISDNGALGTGCSYPHDGGRSDADGGGGDNGGEFHGFGGPCGQSAAANAPPSSAGKRDAGHSAPATNLRPTAATGVTATTMGSAFVRQLGSPVLQELLMQSSPVKSHGSSRGDSAPQYKYQSLNEQPTPALPAVRGRHQPDSAAVSDTTTAPSLHAAHYRRPSSGAHSNASSTDAERVHPWTGGRGMDSMGMGSNGTPYESPSAPRYLRSSGGVVVSGGGSVGSNDATRAFDSRRSSIGELSDMSSLDAARVYPSMGADDPNSSTIRLHSADGSLELMAAVPLPHSSAYDSEGGEDVGCSRERRRSISGRSVGGGSWLLLSPTVVVMEASGGSGAAVRALDVDREEGAREVASGAEAAEAIANQVQSHATQHQDKQQEEQQNGQVDSDAGLIRHGSIAGADKHYSNQEEDGEQEPSVAASPTSPPPRTPYDADGGVGSGSGSTTPTPRADLSFAFHSASFAMREGSGDEDADGKDWLHRNNLDDDDGSGGRRGDGDGGRAYGRPGALTALGSHRVGHDDDYDVGDDDEILQTPTHDSSWTRLKLRNPSGGTGDGTAASDADSDAGGASAAAAAAASRRRWQIQQRDESASSAVPGAIGLYDGYSEEEAEDDREGTDNRYGARRRQREAMRSSESLPVSALSSTAAQRAAAADLYHSFSFPSTESAVRAAEAEAAAAAVSSSSLKAATLNNASGSAGSSTSGSVAGMLGSPAMVGISNITEGGGDVIHHRVARPIRILVPSSPRSSMGGWSVPSPVPSPYTHGVGAMRTPSPGGKNTNFSLRNHLNLTVSSCLFAETSSSDEGDEYEYGYDGDVGTRQYAESRLVVGYESSPQLQQRQLRQHAGSDEGGEDEGEDEDEVEEGEEVTSRPTSWPRDKAGEIGRRNEEEEALEVEEEEDIPLAGDDEDEATAAVAAWAYGDARRAVVEVAQAARNAGNGGGAGGGADGLAAGDD